MLLIFCFGSVVPARLSRHLVLVIPRILQEFNTGAKLYVGGLEAAHEVLEGENLSRIDCVFDCRNDQTKGRGRTVMGGNLLRARDLPPPPPHGSYSDPGVL